MTRVHSVSCLSKHRRHVSDLECGVHAIFPSDHESSERHIDEAWRRSAGRVRWGECFRFFVLRYQGGGYSLLPPHPCVALQHSRCHTFEPHCKANYGAEQSLRSKMHVNLIVMSFLRCSAHLCDTAAVATSPGAQQVCPWGSASPFNFVGPWLPCFT